MRNSEVSKTLAECCNVVLAAFRVIAGQSPLENQDDPNDMQLFQSLYQRLVFSTTRTDVKTSPAEQRDLAKVMIAVCQYRCTTVMTWSVKRHEKDSSDKSAEEALKEIISMMLGDAHDPKRVMAVTGAMELLTECLKLPGFNLPVDLKQTAYGEMDKHIRSVKKLSQESRPRYHGLIAALELLAEHAFEFQNFFLTQNQDLGAQNHDPGEM
jgi:hypothetical protein